ncbi:phage tail tape measure protein [Clostridium tyrobutyricum]|uniref:phage tail tape measure protein n=1 Tax=Clostridium tyrobutyricum TaxID=1519 RepID=UPI001C3D9177|nr:phage tail tape measure protein [Clostridium tyrobutyricum]MBV4438582.1 phage tail tape measure protein [Clostridium tyrobutyricum]
MGDLNLGALSYTLKLKKDGSWGNLKIAQTDIKKTGDQTKIAAKEAQELGSKWDSTGGILKRIGIAALFTGIGTSIASMAKKGISSAMDLETSMNKFRAQTGMTGQDADKVKQTITNLYTATGRSFDELRQLATNLHNQMDMSATDIQKYAASFTTYSKVTEQNSSDAVTAIAGIKNAWHLSNADIQSLMDKLIVSQQKYGLTVGESQQSLKSLAPAFQALGMNINQGIGYLDLFHKAGLDSSAATAAFRIALTKVKSPKELQNVITQMQKTSDNSKRAQLGIEYFGKQGIAMAAALKPGSASLSDIQKSLTGATGATSKAAGEMGKNLPAQIAKLKNMLNGLFLQLGQQVVPVIQKVVEYIIKNMPTIQKTLSNLFKAVIPVVQTVAKILGNLFTFISNHGEIAKKAIIGLAGAFAVFSTIKGVNSAINGTKKLIDDIKVSANNAKTAINKLQGEFSKISSTAKIAGNNIANFAKAVGERATQGLKIGIDLAKKFGSSLLNVGKNALTTAGRIASMTGKIIAQGAAWIATNAKALIYKATNLALAAAEKIAAAAQAALNLVMSMNPIGLIIIAISGLIAAIVLLYRKNEWFRNMINAIWTNVKNVVVGAVNWIKNAWNTCINWFSTLPARLKTHAINMFVAFKNGAASIINSIGSWIKNKFQAFMNFFKNLPKQALQWGKDIVNQLKAGINNKINDVVNTAKNLGKKILDGIKGIFGIHSPSREMFKVGDYLVQGLQNGILNGKSSLQTVISKIFGGALSFAKGIFSNGDVKGWLTTALAITGQPMAALPALEAIAMHESGGNPNSINLWDSNAKAGHPSKGLMQTIDSTFNQYAIKGLGDIWNPVANAVAAIRYMLDQYGSIWNVPGIRNMASGGGYVGYASGTTSATKGWHITGENGPEMEWFNGGETVFNANDTQNILKIPGLIQVLINQIAKTGSLINSTINNLIISPNVLNKSMTATTVSPKDLSDNTIQIIVKDNTFLTKKSMDDFVSKISNTIYLNTKRRK